MAILEVGTLIIRNNVNANDVISYNYANDN